MRELDGRLVRDAVQRQSLSQRCDAAGPFPGLQWVPSQRKAYALLVFGLVVGILCTRATLQVSMVPCWSSVPAGDY